MCFSVICMKSARMSTQGRGISRHSHDATDSLRVRVTSFDDDASRPFPMPDAQRHLCPPWLAPLRLNPPLDQATGVTDLHLI
jgi:hypothetical protein